MELLTVKEVSKKLRLNVNDTYRLIKSGHIQALKLGAMKVTSFELERFIKECSGKDYSDMENIMEFKA